MRPCAVLVVVALAACAKPPPRRTRPTAPPPVLGPWLRVLGGDERGRAGAQQVAVAPNDDVAVAYSVDGVVDLAPTTLGRAAHLVRVGARSTLVVVRYDP